MTNHVSQRNVALTAFALDPNAGSEPGAGWLLVKTASSLSARVMVITEAERITPELKKRCDELNNVELIGIPSGRLFRAPIHLRYGLWLIKAGRLLDQLAESNRINITHHATYASDWMPAPYFFMTRRVEHTIWGPVGGNTYPPTRLTASLGVKFFISEWTRLAITRALRGLSQRRMQSLTDFAIAINGDSLKSLNGYKKKVRHPNVGWSTSDIASLTGGMEANLSVESHTQSQQPAYPSDVGPRSGRPFELVFASRLLNWKGIHLAVDAAEALGPKYRLTIIGDGPATSSVKTRIASVNNVRYLGRLSRAATLANIARSDALLLPSFHDSGPWVAGEAAALGVPVVCLDLGGVADMAGLMALTVPCQPVSSLPARLADGVRQAISMPRVCTTPWTQATLMALLDEAYTL